MKKLFSTGTNYENGAKYKDEVGSDHGEQEEDWKLKHEKKESSEPMDHKRKRTSLDCSSLSSGGCYCDGGGCEGCCGDNDDDEDD
jgi:hypothetical protein